MKRLCTLLTLVCLMSLTGVTDAWAQYATWEDCLASLLTEDDALDETTMETLTELLTDLHQHPIVLNTATRAELEQLPFLTPHQVEEILYYLDLHGPLHNAGELILIPALDADARRLLPWFVRWDEGKAQPSLPLQELLTHRKSEVTLRTDIPLYERAGYGAFTREDWEKSPSRYYWGLPMYNSLRYASHSGERLSWGLAAERDAGEPFLVKGIDGELLGKQGFDYYGGFVRLRDTGRLRDLIVGNYRLHFGQGLVMNGSFNLGKNSATGTFERALVGSLISSHGGTGESGYQRGIAATLALGQKGDLTTFLSYRPCDATLDGEAVTTLLKTGLHRTSLELDKRHNTHIALAGSHLRYHLGGLHLGATLTGQTFDRPLTTGTQAYRQHSPQGRTFVNASADYAYCTRRITLAGETALSGNGALATLNTLRAEPFDRTYLSLLYRRYSMDYWALQANAFGEGSEVRNEEGVYLCADVQAVNHWRFTGSADLFRFPGERYRVSAPSQGCDLQALVEWTPNTQWDFTARWRCKVKERNGSADSEKGDGNDENGLVQETTQRLHLSAEGTWSPAWTTQTTVDGCLVAAEEESRGVRIGERLIWTPPTRESDRSICKGWSLSGEGAWFYTTDYAARLYAYERGLLYAWNYHSYYGHGLRGAAMVKCTLWDRLIGTLKVSSTYYFDRDAISSGAQCIPQNHAEDIALQVRWKF